MPTDSVPWLRSIISFLVAEVGHQPFPLVQVERNAFIVVIGELRQDN
jgi:hypothetical protein